MSTGAALVRLRGRARLLCVVAVVVAALAWSAFSLFAGGNSRNQAGSSGTLTITLDPSGAGNRFSIAATNLVPGDTIDRAVNVTYDGSVGITAMTLTTTATTSTALDTDAVDGLQLTVTRCSVPWTETLASGIPTSYTCSGSTSTAIAARAVITTAQPLSSAVTTAAQTNYFLVHLTLPHTAGNSFENAHSVIQFAFKGVQRASAFR